MSSPESTITVAGLCTLRALPGTHLGRSLAIPPIPNWKRPVRLVKKDVIAATKNIARSNVLIVRHEINLLIYSN